MSAAFDEGGSSGLLLSNLRTFDNTQRLVLDSNTLVTPIDDLDTSRIEARKESVDVSDCKGLFKVVLSFTINNFSFFKKLYNKCFL